MARTSELAVVDLNLDLKNFRTVPQKKEQNAIKAMIAIKPDRFHAIMESILEDGYIPTENIIVLKDGSANVVKEGNRRIAALKIILGIYKSSDFNLPASIQKDIEKVSDVWKLENGKVPCTIFSEKEADKANKVVALTHAKGEKAGRDPWSSVARARYNRDVKNQSEPCLDLLEKYIKHGTTLNKEQVERWSGDYQITILEDAMRNIHSRFNVSSIVELARNYPKVKYIKELDCILRDIGLEQVTHTVARSAEFGDSYGIKSIVPTGNSNTATGANNGGATNTPSSVTGTTAPISKAQATPTSKSTAKAYASNDPKHVHELLKRFNPKGVNREKVVLLRNEIRILKIPKNPIAFCFLLRSMFEISASAYSKDHAISTKKLDKKKGTLHDKTLAEVLGDITTHLTKGNPNPVNARAIHGAMTELGKKNGILSITSMNQLVHSSFFSITAPDICILFGNIYPLLEAMNK